MQLVISIIRKNSNQLRIDVYKKGNDKVTITKNYNILSQQFSTERFKEITREHWNIECSLIGD